MDRAFNSISQMNVKANGQWKSYRRRLRDETQTSEKDSLRKTVSEATIGVKLPCVLLVTIGCCMKPFVV